MIKCLLACTVVLLVNSCGNFLPRAAPKSAAAAGMPQPPRGVPAYRIDAAQSEVRVLVYRAGAAARLGHNHVIVNHSLSGWVSVAATPSAATFYLQMPCADFSIDDAAARRAEGADFEAAVAPDAIAGTRSNMLGAAVLDAENFPVITLKSLAIVAAAGTLSATTQVQIAGHRSSIVVPVTLDRQPTRLAVQGSVKLRQSALGLTPFSVMLGALQVQDEIAVRFTIVATIGVASAGIAAPGVATAAVAAGRDYAAP